MTRENFKSNLKYIQESYYELEKRFQNLKKCLSETIFEDVSFVPNSIFYDIIRNNLITLFLSVKETVKLKTLRDEIDYYFIENGFDGEVSYDGKKYNLSNPDEFYDYILTL